MRERGQANVEWLGAMLVVVALVAAVVLVAPRLAPTIGCKLAEVISGEAGACAEEEQRAEQPPCVVSDREGRVKASLTVFSVKGGGDVRALVQERSDGTVWVTLSGGGNLGLELGPPAGAKASLEGFGRDIGGGADAKAGVSFTGEAGGTWRFDDRAAADEFLEIVRNRARDGAISAGGGPIAGGLWELSPFDEDRDVRAPDVVYGQAGIQGSAKADAGNLAAYGSVGADGSAVLGARHDRETGETTVFLQVKGNATLNANLGLDGVAGQAEGDVQLAVTYGRDGEPRSARILARGAYGGDADLGAAYKGITPEQWRQDPKGFLKSIGFGAASLDGRRGELQLDLDLTDASNRRAYEDFLRDPALGAVGLADRFVQDAAGQVRVYDQSRDRVGGSASGSLFDIKFGIEAGFEGTGGTIAGAWLWDPTSRELEPWVACTGAS
jgi:hypothetical protein